jgi:hypothetical protein
MENTIKIISANKYQDILRLDTMLQLTNGQPKKKNRFSKCANAPFCNQIM